MGDQLLSHFWKKGLVLHVSMDNYQMVLYNKPSAVLGSLLYSTV